MKMFLIVLSPIVILLVSGCASSSSQTPVLSPNTKHIVFVDGNPYRIPIYTQRYDKITKEKNAQIFRMTGLDCRRGDVLWRKPSTYKGNDLGENAFYAVKHNEMGCSHRLSDREYEYYKELEAQRLDMIKEQLAIIRSRRAYRAATAPIRHEVDVNVHGSVYNY